MGASAIPNLLRTIRLDEACINEILAHLDETNKPAAANRRDGERYRYRAPGCVMHVQNPGAETTTAFLIYPHNLSASGMAFLHGGFVYPGTRCVIRLVNLRGSWKNIEAVVVRCSFRKANVHHVAVRFKQKIDPAEFCPDAGKPP